MQIKSVIIDNIHYINFMFNISTLFFFFLICPSEIGVGILYAIKYGNLCMIFFSKLYSRKTF